ncbi:MAG: cell envelope integrity protein CreD [Bacteroidales bacterium]|nr:cell envelope integrity protein CreD [Bacteroidales bacterium]
MKIEISDNKKWQLSLTIKMALLAVMGLMLLIPLEMIKSVIRERQQNSEKVKKEIAFQWAGNQNISGPVLNIPVMIYPSKNKAEPYRSIFHLMPELLDINGDIQTEKRHRSIYQAVVYTADLKLSGEFIIPELNTGEKSDILWNESYYTLGISDNRGLKGGISLRTDSITIEAIPGLKDSEVFNSGITFPVALPELEKRISFNMSLKISGSEDLNFSPLGKTTKVNLRSPWISPGFNGQFLPVSRTISKAGFNAEWLVTNLNRNFPQSWTGNAYNPINDSFGVDFVLLVDHYQKSLRSAKYGILFIALTFLVLLFAELTLQERLHVFHYLLVSLALVLFFSLLNALSEQIGFNMAYLVSASSTIIMISIFVRTLIRNYRPALLISVLLVFLYSFIFILLTLNDYAYLAGNIGLFILLAITMRLSVKLRLFTKDQGTDQPE